jgi:rhamnopyranosyl-N-acetylglucosaminyl-diphospho-decaprenol beta-1,3/1,4-galactofuranosyltransferase
MYKITCIIVTFNRHKLLIECIKSILRQSYSPAQILIIDNASTDGTRCHLTSQGFIDNALISYHLLPMNIGGAGGFSEGIKLAMSSGADWIWLIDDDAMPQPDALEKLLQHSLDENCVYGSVAIGEDGEHLCWPVETDNGQKLNTLKDVNKARLPVVFQPFLGFLINKKLVEKVGLPDADFFLSGDDVDYSLRIANQGGKIYLCRDSIIRHPLPPKKSINLFFFKMDLLVQSPERAYYNIRNKIIISRRYYGFKLWIQTLPGILIRLFWSLIYRTDRISILKSYLMALAHGFMGRLGKFN